MSLIIAVVVLSLTFMCASTRHTYDIQCGEERLLYETSKNSSLNESNIRDFINIVLHCETVILKKSFKLTNISRLYIKGTNRTRIRCEESADSNIFVQNVTNVTLEYLNVENCGSRSDKSSPAIMILDCKNVTITNITINNSKGTGMILNRNEGIVIIKNTFFLNCGQKHELRFYQYNGGGLVIKYPKHFVQITNCVFKYNCAYSGGGMAIIIEHAADIVIENSIFSSNAAQIGGGIRITYHNFEPAKNITFNECTFENNSAVKGGGTSVTFATLKPLNLIFRTCLWKGNSFEAVNLENQRTTRSNFTPIFFNCNFTENGNINATENTNAVEGNAFVITNLAVRFLGMTVFEKNVGSALKVVSSLLTFGNNSINKFVGNKGIRGGALQFLGSSAINLSNSNQFFEFRQNTAKEKGGAIYVDPYKYISFLLRLDCFVRTPINFLSFAESVFFEGNIIEGSKKEDILHAVSLWPCLQQNVIKRHAWSKKTIQKLADGQFSTAAHMFVSNDEIAQFCPISINSTSNFVTINKTRTKQNTGVSMETVYAIPGKTHMLHLRLVDEFCKEASFDVRVSIDNFEIECDKVMHNRTITLYGHPDAEAKMTLTALYSTSNIFSLYAYVDVVMDHCPPGFVFDTEKKECICSSSSVDNRYSGITHCKKNRAYVRQGYWVGYINDSHIPDTFASSICPEGFCRSCSNYSCVRDPLGSNRSEDTSSVVCNENRQGVMCGKCKQNHSTYYHSNVFSCKENKNCKLGWLFYILSELLPVTILFLVIIFFNISFTSGPLNGVILFMQLVDTMKINGENFIVFEDHIKEISKIYKLVYQIFTLKFFALDTFSFCLWEGTSALDMLAFRYVTIIYSLLLVFFTIFLLRLCSVNQRTLSLKRSIIHGLSAFLVISYSECTRVSLSLVTVGTLYVSPNRTNPNKYVAFYDGDYAYMKDEHIKYTIPAMFFLLTLVAIPPLLLLTYPLCYKVFALLKIEESKCVRITCKIFPLEKIKPLFDSMQGAFKDRFRFFAGLYFLYRLLTQLPFVYASRLTSYYSITAVQLAIMLFLHALCRPYKNSWHNILDCFFFLLLNVINIISSYNYEMLCLPKNDTYIKWITLFSNVQCVLILLPLVYLTVYIIYRTVLKFKRHCKCVKKRKRDDHEDSDYILHELDTRSIDE